MDAVLAYDEHGSPVEPEWPDADVIIGNPPFLGDKKMREGLGDKYVDDLRQLYEGRVPGGADLVTYWFERARAEIERGTGKRAGLLATNSIRMVGNRPVVERLKKRGDIFMAWSDRPWVLAGANVRVSMIGFDDGKQLSRTLDGIPVSQINADLTTGLDVASANPLSENRDLCFLGMMKGGPFDIKGSVAQEMLAAPLNPNGRPNSDVVKHRFGGRDITSRPRDGWVINFVEMSEAKAALYELPFEYVRTHVKPKRDNKRDVLMRTKWWLHGRSRPALRKALNGLTRCIVTPEVAKHRMFIWIDVDVVPDHKLHVIARDDDYFFGVLQSRPHLLWADRLGSTLEDRPSYNSETIFSTYPFPWPPRTEPKDDPRLQVIAGAAQELVNKRDAWLNPSNISATELRKRTLTKLYNGNPTWLRDAHRTLDDTVFAAYGWPTNLTDQDILTRLLQLNQERFAAQQSSTLLGE
jgi:hypothetical protein